MKKQLAKMLAVALAGAMCLGIAACGEDEEKAPEELSAEEIVGVEVTAEQWKAAVEQFSENDEKCTAIILMEQVYEVTDYPSPDAEGGKISGKASYNGEALAIKNGSKEYMKSETKISGDEAVKNNVLKGMGEEVFEQYIERTADSNFDYQQEDGKWKKRSISSNKVGFSVSVGHFFDYYAFEDATFSAEEKGYVIDEGSTGPHTILKFNDQGKLVAVIQSQTSERDGIKMTMSQTVTISYDAEEIVLPTVEE